MNSFKLSRSACTGLIRAPPAALRPLRTPLRLICVKSVPENTTAASAAANSSIAAASDTQPAPPTTTAQPDRPNVSSSDRKPKRKSNRQQPATVLESGVAASAGALPDVLSATWPAKFPTLSAARRVIRKDLILVDGAVGSCKTEVAPGQRLEQLEPVVRKGGGPRTVSLQVLYEDDDLAVVHKPWGVKMYGGDGRRTITGALKAGALNPSSSPDALPEPKPLHRLDAAVGGVLLIAKTAAAAADISLQFKERRVHKVYHALLCGRLEPGVSPSAAAAAAAGDGDGGGGGDGFSGEKEAAASSQQQQQQQQQQQSDDGEEESEGPTSTSDEDSAEEEEPLLPLSVLLQRQLQGAPAFSPSAAAALAAADPVLQLRPDADTTADASTTTSSSSDSSEGVVLGHGVHVVDLAVGRSTACSLYRVNGYSRSARYGSWVTSVALSPVTGRKHQLRRHMAALGCPIVGDGKYALSKEEHISNQGIYLESLELSFTHPRTGDRLHISMPEPARFATMRQQLHNRWRKVTAQLEQQQPLEAETSDGGES